MDTFAFRTVQFSALDVLSSIFVTCGCTRFTLALVAELDLVVVKRVAFLVGCVAGRAVQTIDSA